MLIHGVGPDQRTWISLFSLCYFHHKKDSDASRSKNQAHSLDGIVMGRSPTLNAILVYYPRNQQYNDPDSYQLDPYQLPLSVYPSIVYDGGLLVSLHREDIAPISKPYPPALELRMSIHTKTPLNRVLWWTSQWIPIDLHTTWSKIMMAPPDPFLLQICSCWSQNHQSMLWTPLIICHLSWNSIPKSRLNMIGIPIKATSLNDLMGLIISVTNCTSTKNKRTGGFP